MVFTIKDRIILGCILGARKQLANVTSLKIIRQFREDLSFSEEEHSKLNLSETSDGVIKWDETAEFTKEMEVSDVVTVYIRRLLLDLNREEKIHEDWLELYDRFVVNE